MVIFFFFLRIRLAPEKLQQMESRLNSGARAQYFMDHHVTKHWIIEKGRVSYRIENLNHANFLPKAIICGLMDYDELTGLVAWF